MTLHPTDCFLHRPAACGLGLCPAQSSARSSRGLSGTWLHTKRSCCIVQQFLFSHLTPCGRNAIRRRSSSSRNGLKGPMIQHRLAFCLRQLPTGEACLHDALRGSRAAPWPSETSVRRRKKPHAPFAESPIPPKQLTQPQRSHTPLHTRPTYTEPTQRGGATPLLPAFVGGAK